jgi:hypothetical protein
MNPRPAGAGEHVTALLRAGRVEKHLLGMGLSGEVLRHDVTQIAVNNAFPARNSAGSQCKSWSPHARRLTIL